MREVRIIMRFGQTGEVARERTEEGDVRVGIYGAPDIQTAKLPEGWELDAERGAAYSPPANGKKEEKLIAEALGVVKQLLESRRRPDNSKKKATGKKDKA